MGAICWSGLDVKRKCAFMWWQISAGQEWVADDSNTRACMFALLIPAGWWVGTVMDICASVCNLSPGLVAPRGCEVAAQWWTVCAHASRIPYLSHTSLLHKTYGRGIACFYDRIPYLTEVYKSSAHLLKLSSLGVYSAFTVERWLDLLDSPFVPQDRHGSFPLDTLKLTCQL